MTPSRDPLSLLLAALRAAGNLCEKAKQQHARTVKDLITLPAAAVTGGARSVVDLCIKELRSAAAVAASEASTRWPVSPRVASSAAGGWAGGWRAGGTQGSTEPSHVGHGGIVCPPSTDFFGTFVFTFVSLLSVCWCDSWVCKTGAGSWTLTLYDPVSWCVCSTHCETCLHTRARVHEDQDDLWREQPVFLD